MKKALALILVLVMVLSCAACGSSGNDKEAGSPANTSNTPADNGGNESGNSAEEPVSAAGYVADNITVASSSDGGTFDPFASFVNWGDATMSGLIFQHLIMNDFDYNVYYEIAKEITQVDDTHWQLVIWDCVYDTAGNQITMDDIVWCYDQVIASGNMGAIPKFVKMEKVDDFTGIMELSEPFGAGDFDKHFGNVTVLSKTTYEDVAGGDMTTNPIGTGPYKLKDYTVGSEVVLEVNEDYWGVKAGIDDPFDEQNFKTITYEIIQDASSRAIALEMGTVDICDNMEAVDIKNLNTDEFNLINCPVRPPVAIVLNANEASVLSSKELRQAILYGLDNASIAASLGLPAEQVYGLQPAMVDAPASWTTGEGRSYYDYDPDKVAELLAESGYNNEEITLLYVSSTVTDAAAIQIQAQLKKVGIAIKLLSVDQTTAMDYQYDATKWDIRIATLGGGAYMSQTVKSWWSEDIAQHVDNGENFSLVPDATLDGLYVALRDDPSEANINAWAEYFDEQAYGYSICSYADQTACNGAYQPSIQGNSGWSVVPNAFVAAE